MLTVARYLVFKKVKDGDFIEGLKYLRPKRENTVVSRPIHNKAVIEAAIKKIDTAKNKRGYDAFRPYDKVLNWVLITFAFYTGVRSNEICSLRIQDVDLKADSLKLFGKGSKVRYVGICTELKQALKDYMREKVLANGSKKGVRVESEFFFVSQLGTKLEPSYIARRLKRLGKYLENIKDFKPHSIRRTSITWMLNEKKLPIPIVRDAVGHSSLEVTNLYAQPTANDVIEAMKQL